jgi:hypothetical protein
MVSKSCSDPGVRPACFIIDPRSIRCVTARGVFVPADKLTLLSQVFASRSVSLPKAKGNEKVAIPVLSSLSKIAVKFPRSCTAAGFIPDVTHISGRS